MTGERNRPSNSRPWQERIMISRPPKKSGSAVCTSTIVSWTSLRDEAGHAIMEIIDSAAHYGLRLTAFSQEVKALQLYAPPDPPFVALEPQFNWTDPFSDIWPPETDTGMVVLAPGEHVRWAIRCELFVVCDG